MPRTSPRASAKSPRRPTPAAASPRCSTASAASCCSRRTSAQLFNFIPSSVASAFNSPAVTLYICEGDRIYLSDPKRISSPHIQWQSGRRYFDLLDRPRAEIVRDLREP